jgi:NDP-sugar pyrophosphorylase family protein
VTIRHALIMAAGRGMRMMPLTTSMPKAMAPYRGSTLIASRIGDIRAQVPNVHVTVGYRGAKLAGHVIRHGAATVINTEGHGNAWWLFNTFLSLLDEPVLVLTCDNVTAINLEFLEQDYAARGRPPCMLVPVEPIPGLDGDHIFTAGDDRVTRLSRQDPAPLYCSGIQVVNPRAIARHVRPVEDFGDVWAGLIQQRQLASGTEYPEAWFAADTIEQLRAIHSAS